MEFSRQEYWSGLPFPSPGNLPNTGIEHWSPMLRADSLLPEPQDTKCYTLRKSPQSSCLITFQLCHLSNIMFWLKQLKTSMFKIASLGEIPWQSRG